MCSEFHQWLIVACSIKSYRYIFAIVLIYEKRAAEQDPLGMEQRTDVYDVVIAFVEFRCLD
jgi:hypothetical protein